MIFAILLLCQTPAITGSPLAVHISLRIPNAHTKPLRSVTAEACTSSSDCEGERACIEDSRPQLEVPCQEGISCACFPKVRKRCSQTADCDDMREVCSKMPKNGDHPPDLEGPYCMSAVITGYKPDMKEVLGGPKRVKRSPSRGKTLFPCASDEDCIGKRSCMFKESPEKHPVRCESRGGCFCFPVHPKLCEEKLECETGELCARVREGIPICVAADAESAIPEVSALGEETNPTITGAADTEKPETPTGGGRNGPRTMDGVTGDSCKLSKECDRDRICVFQSKPLEFTPCDDEEECICSPRTGPKVCAADDDCEEREICATIENFPNPLCLSTVLVGYIDILKPVSENSKAGRSPGSGFTLYPCQKDQECEGDRTCILSDASEPTSCQMGDTCLCFPKEPKICSESQQCESREVCADYDDVRLCVSEDVEATFQEISGDSANSKPEPPTDPTDPDSDMKPPESETDDNGDDDLTPKPPSPPDNVVEDPAPGTGLSPPDNPDNPDPNKGDSDKPSSSSEDGSFSKPEESDESDDAEASEEPTSSTEPSASSSSSPTESTDTNAACIDATALMHMDAADLVFPRHSWSNVLCDSNDSCATKGHIVTFNGEAMMMETYCGVVTCSERVVQVNSPKYRRGLRVESKTEGLHYTAFAARYETSAEEAMMAAAVRVGL